MRLASAIFAIAAAVALTFYTAAHESYKAGQNFADQQQETRVGFDRMISDIRLAGFNTNPDGDTSRVDEQVEGAWDTAVTAATSTSRIPPPAPRASPPCRAWSTTSYRPGTTRSSPMSWPSGVRPGRAS
jgi:Tfp pilus assembly protein PilW